MNLQPRIVISISKMPNELILEPLAAMQPALLFSKVGFECPKHSLKLPAFMHVIAAPVSNNQLNVFFPVVTFILGQILFPPWKGIMISESLL